MSGPSHVLLDAHKSERAVHAHRMLMRRLDLDICMLISPALKSLAACNRLRSCRHQAGLHLRAAGEPTPVAGIAQPGGGSRRPASGGLWSAERPSVHTQPRTCAANPSRAARTIAAAGVAHNTGRAADSSVPLGTVSAAAVAAAILAAAGCTGAIITTADCAGAASAATTAGAACSRIAACRGTVAGPETAGAAAANPRSALAPSRGARGAAVLPGAQWRAAARRKCAPQFQLLGKALICTSARTARRLSCRAVRRQSSVAR